MVMLMVSDPQIIGIQEEMGFPVGPLARWDSDRYDNYLIIGFLFLFFLGYANHHSGVFSQIM